MFGRKLRAMLDALLNVGPVETLSEKMVRETSEDLTVALAKDHGWRSQGHTARPNKRSGHGDHDATAA
jgi:hypothetical protein